LAVDELRDIEAIRRLTHDYGFAFDTRDYEGYAECFTEDGVLDSTPCDPSVPPARGRAAIAALLRATAEQQVGGKGGGGSMHQQLNHRIDVDGDRASGTVYFVALGQLKAGNRYEWDGYYEDQYVRTPDGWKFASRVLRPLMPIDSENLDYSTVSP
jgi:ketosteroid isomerase-like protein